MPSSPSSGSKPFVSCASNQNSQLTVISGGQAMNGGSLSCTLTSTMQLLILPKTSVTRNSTITVFPTSQQANGAQGWNVKPLSMDSGGPPSLFGYSPLGPIQSKSIQLTILLTRNVTGPQLS